MLQFTDLPEIHTRPLSFGRETHVPCVGPQGPNTQDQAGRFMAETGHHLEDVMANCRPPWCCWKGGRQDHSTPSGPSDNSGRNMVSSVFITVGDPDTPWHPHFFRVPAFDRRQWKNASSIPRVHGFPHLVAFTVTPYCWHHHGYS